MSLRAWGDGACDRFFVLERWSGLDSESRSSYKIDLSGLEPAKEAA